jgi:protein-export membrane protein SecD
MLHFSRWRAFAIVSICLLGVVFSLPNMFSRETVDSWPTWVPRKQIPAGLDLQGGAHLLLAMDSSQLRRDWLAGLREDARRTLINDAKIAASATIQGGPVLVKLTKPEQMDQAMRELRRIQEQIGNLALGTTGTNVDLRRGEGGTITITPTESGFTQRVANAATAAIETINRRINALGTAESTVVRQGSDRILIQYPGLKDVQQLKDLIGKTAKLSFHEVHPSVTPEEAQQGRAPPGWRIYPSDEPGGPPYLLRDTPVVAGEELTDAQPGFDQQTNEPVINFRFNQQGARKFGRYTQANVGRPFAILLDDRVISAPVIQTAILGGTGQISGRFTVESANALAVQLRSGALPVKLEIAEERTVGPSLGSDSIAAGRLAGIIGCIATIIMTIAAYGTFGIFAVIALISNGLLVVALMSGIGITLTLPGIAGLVLTIGMAVDANVLIYERIREELRAGRTAISAIEAGFSRAIVTILDSQLTTLAAALLMFWLGSGPIRGFAVTLSIGIFTSIFSAVFVTRLLAATWLRTQRGRPQKIAVPI